MFPLMCYTQEDDELWQKDPYEFIRVKYDIFEDFVSPVTAAATLIHTSVSKQKQVLDPIMVFCGHVLNLPGNQRTEGCCSSHDWNINNNNNLQ